MGRRTGLVVRSRVTGRPGICERRAMTAAERIAELRALYENAAEYQDLPPCVHDALDRGPALLDVAAALEKWNKCVDADDPTGSCDALDEAMTALQRLATLSQIV